MFIKPLRLPSGLSSRFLLPLFGLICLLSIVASPAGASVDNTDPCAPSPGKDPALTPPPGCRAHLAHLDRSGRDGEGQAGQNEWEVRFYQISGEIDFENLLFDGHVTIWLKPVAPTDSLVLDALENMTIEEVTLDDQPAGKHRSDERTVTIEMSELVLDQEYKVDIDYTAGPNNEGFGWGCFVFPTYTYSDQQHQTCHSMTETQYAGSWWPCIDRLTHKPDGVELTITVPDTMMVASNGVLEGVYDDQPGKRTYHWREYHPIATYLVSITVAPFGDATNTTPPQPWPPELSSAGAGWPWESEYESVTGETFPIQHFIWKEHLNREYTIDDQPDNLRMPRNMLAIEDMMACYEELFGPYPFRDEKYGTAEFIFGGGMEHQTIGSIGSLYVTSADSLNYVQHHELSHQWFGDWISPATWEDIWLNEGFATYSEALFFECADRYSAGEYMFNYRRLSRDRLFPGSIYEPNDYFNHTVYWKGAWVLHMLRQKLGDDEFFQLLKDWTTAGVGPGAGGVATTAQFEAMAQNYTAEDLGPFFQNWLHGTGRPIFRHFYLSEATDVGDWNVNFTLEQTQDGALFSQNVDLLFGFEEGDTLVTVPASEQTETYRFIFPHRPLSMSLDPEHKLLHNATEIAVGSEPVQFLSGIMRDGVVEIELILVKEGRLKGDIYDVTGRHVRRLSDEHYPIGELNLSWDGRDDNGEVLASSVYFLKLKHRGHTETGKLLLVR